MLRAHLWRMRLLAIGFIWLGCALAWLVLGTTLQVRSGESSGELHREVSELWGAPMTQQPLQAHYRERVERREVTTTVDPQGRETQTVQRREEWVDVPLELVRTVGKVHLALEQRRKGLLWFPTYVADVELAYAVENGSEAARAVVHRFPFPGNDVSLDDFTVLDADGKQRQVRIDEGGATWTLDVPPGARTEHTVRYRARGTSRWEYGLGQGGQARDVTLTVETDFAEVDFPSGTLSPTRHGLDALRWQVPDGVRAMNACACSSARGQLQGQLRRVDDPPGQDALNHHVLEVRRQRKEPEGQPATAAYRLHSGSCLYKCVTGPRPGRRHFSGRHS